MATQSLSYDALIDASGANGADFTTLQAADDAGAKNLYVKNGTYTTLTVATNNTKWTFEPGVVTGAIVVSGAENQLEFGPACDITGLLTLSGVDNHVQCENGCDFDGILMSAARNFFDGGGWDTLSDGASAAVGINVTGDDCIIQNIAAQTEAGGSGGFATVGCGGARGTYRLVKVINSDNDGFQFATGNGDDSLLEGCVVLDSD